MWNLAVDRLAWKSTMKYVICVKHLNKSIITKKENEKRSLQLLLTLRSNKMYFQTFHKEIYYSGRGRKNREGERGNV